MHLALQPHELVVGEAARRSRRHGPPRSGSPESSPTSEATSPCADPPGGAGRPAGRVSSLDELVAARSRSDPRRPPDRLGLVARPPGAIPAPGAATSRSNVPARPPVVVAGAAPVHHDRRSGRGRRRRPQAMRREERRQVSPLPQERACLDLLPARPGRARTPECFRRVHRWIGSRPAAIALRATRAPRLTTAGGGQAAATAPAEPGPSERERGCAAAARSPAAASAPRPRGEADRAERGRRSAKLGVRAEDVAAAAADRQHIRCRAPSRRTDRAPEPDRTRGDEGNVLEHARVGPPGRREIVGRRQALEDGVRRIRRRRSRSRRDRRGSPRPDGAKPSVDDLDRAGHEIAGAEPGGGAIGRQTARRRRSPSRPMPPAPRGSARTRKITPKHRRRIRPSRATTRGRIQKRRRKATERRRVTAARRRSPSSPACRGSW